MALALGSAGAAVLVHAARNQRAAEAVAAEIRNGGSAAEVVMVDLEQPAGQDELLHRAWLWRGGVSIWINNAGADVLTGEAAHGTFEHKLESLWLLDVTATIRLSRQAGARMKTAGGGAILNVGWDGADRGMAGDSGQLFAAAKGAVMSFTRSLAQSLAPEVRVNCVAPGWIQTAWGQQASDYWQHRAAHESLLLRWGLPDDVARTALFLVSPAAAFINGQVIYVNGGRREGLGPARPNDI
jgi:3-oxoacyl-[acyl-carrier protein] reductase